MHDGVDPFGRAEHRVAIFDAAEGELHPRKLLEKITLRGRPNQRPHVVPLRRQLLGDVAPEEAARTGDQYLHDAASRLFS